MTRINQSVCDVNLSVDRKNAAIDLAVSCSRGESCNNALLHLNLRKVLLPSQRCNMCGLQTRRVFAAVNKPTYHTC